MLSPLLRTNAKIVLFMALMLAVSYFAFENLTETPPIWYDEGIYTQTAQNAFDFGGSPRVQVAPGVFESAWNSNGGFPFIYPVAASYELLGDSVRSGRIMMALFLIALCAALFFFMKRLYGAPAALASLLLLSTFPVLYGTGKSVLGEVPGLLYLTLFLALLMGFERRAFRASLPYVLLCGLMLGLTAVTKPLFLLAPAAVAVVALINVRRIAWRWDWVLAGSVGALLPVAFHAWVHLLDAPLSTLVQFYANPYALEHVGATVGENLVRLVTEASPLHCTLLFLLWAGRLLWCAYRRIAVSLAEQAAFALALLVLASYLRTAGWYRYFFVADVLSLAFLPISLITLRDMASSYMPRARPFFTAGMFLFAAGLFALHTHSLLGRSWIAEHRASTATKDIADRIALIPDHAALALIDVPELAIVANGRPYYQYLAPTAVFAAGTTTLERVTDGVPDVVIVRKGQEAVYRDLLAGYTLIPGPSNYQFYERSAPYADH